MRGKKIAVLAGIFSLCFCVFWLTGGRQRNGEGNQAGQGEKAQQTEERGDFQKADEPKEKARAQPEMKGTITISCLFEEEFLETAAKQFMKKHPNVTVETHAYRKAGDEVNASTVGDYQTWMNTKVMTGKAEDILLTTYLPIRKYSEMGAFDDFSPYISETPGMKEKNFFMNVLQAAKKESGEIYVLPYQARLNALGFDDVLLSEHPEIEKALKKMQNIGFSDAMEIAKQLVDGTDKKNAFLIQIGEVAYANYLIKESIGSFVDVEKKNVNLDSLEYIALLKQIKELSEDGSFDSDDIDFYHEEFHFAAYSDYEAQAAFYSLDKKAKMAYCMPMTEAEGKVSINANSCIALNSASEQKELAWEFIKYLLSEEIQTLPSIFGFAVNRQGFEASVNRWYNFYGDSKKGNGFVDKAEYRKLLKGWMEQISACDMVDPIIMDFINEENDKFFKNQQTAEQTAKNLQKQVSQYFYE